MSEFVIRDHGTLKEKIQMVEALSDIALATKILESGALNMNPLDSHYKYVDCWSSPHVPCSLGTHDVVSRCRCTRSLRCDLATVEGAERDMINTYMLNTHAATHSKFVGGGGLPRAGCIASRRLVCVW